jgi:hypothetical protein
MLPVTLAAALSTQPPAHVATCNQSAPQTAIVWGAAPGIFWIRTDENTCSPQPMHTTSDHPQYSSDDPQSSNDDVQPLKGIPFNLTTL